MAKKEAMHRFDVCMSEELFEALSQAARERGQGLDEVFRKAIDLYLVAADGVRRGRKFGLVAPENADRLETQIVGI
jgi:hypothetical protein